MNVLDLFSGIGGFSLGLERAGMRTVAFCEIEPFCRAVLRKHWPHVPIYDDVRTLTAERLRSDGIVPDVICGGFPCQDISNAGKRAGIGGERSGLWREYARIIGEVRPRYVIVENVAALLGRGFGVVLGDLAAIRYDAEWHGFPARAAGAPHIRDRLWIVAYPHETTIRLQQVCERRRCSSAVALADCPDLADSNKGGGPTRQQAAASVGYGRAACASGSLMADAAECGRHETQFEVPPARAAREAGGCGCQLGLADADTSDEQWRRCAVQMGWGRFARQVTQDGEFGRAQWGAEPDVGRVAHGVPARVDRLGGLGNAVVPQIPEIIGRAIMRALHIVNQQTLGGDYGRTKI